MADFILLMHDDAPGENGADWTAYLQRLRITGQFRGGSSIGDGICACKSGPPPPVTEHVVGYIRVTADSLEQAKALLAGNPVYEAGGTVEIRALPRTD
jgi:hypothetical protein